MKELSFEQMEKLQAGRSKVAFGAMCAGMAFVLGSITFGIGLIASVACVTLAYDLSVD
jgi:hypothetical protein